jgi:hypothetical protein
MNSKPPVRWLYTLINSGMLAEHRQVILSLLQQLPLRPVLAPVSEVVLLLLVEPRLQALLLLENVIFTNVSAPQQITVVLPATSRETPEPTGKGRIKQSSRRRLPHLFI